MGLPIWRAPSPPGTKDAAKADLSSSSRSPIRRRRASPLHRAATLRRADEFHLNGALPPQLPSRSSSIFSLARPADARRDGEDRAPPLPPVPESRNYRRSLSPPELPTLLSHHRSFQAAASAYPNGYNRPSDFGRGPPTLPQYTPDFAPARTRSPVPFSAEIDAERERFVPPHEFMSRRAQIRAERAFDSYRGPRGTNTAARLHNLMRSYRRPSGRSDPDGLMSIEVSDREHARLQRRRQDLMSEIDGLGDRQRSTTPEDGSGWDAMLVRPDDQLPSADSSFTTAAASASFTNSHPTTRSGSANSGSSARTHLTVPSPRFPTPPSHEDMHAMNCESSSESGSDTEEEDESAAYHIRRFFRPPSPANQSRRMLLMRAHEDSSRLLAETSHLPTLQTNPGSNPVLEDSFTSDEEHERFIRDDIASRTERRRRLMSASNEADALGRARIAANFQLVDSSGNPASNPHMRDIDLEQIRPVLERFARRGDIPEDFWLSVGLTPIMAQNVDRAEATSRAREEIDRSSDYP